MGEMKVLVITGAGVSAAAGLPTFRSPDGIWSDENFQRMSHAHCYGNYLELLIPKWRSMAEAAAAAEPTLFHSLLAERGWPIITQNVDGLHQRAGSKEVLEVHGTLSTWEHMRSPKKDFPFEELPAEAERLKVRPKLVLFGERLKGAAKALATVRTADVVIFVGTSGNVFPVAEWHRFSKRAILVDPMPWEDMEGFTKHFSLTSDEWASEGFPLC